MDRVDLDLEETDPVKTDLVETDQVTPIGETDLAAMEMNRIGLTDAT